jgi:hypothetical protein
MQVKAVHLSYKRKVDLGGFNSAEVSAMISADLDQDDNLDQSMHALWDMVKENVKAQIVPLHKESRAGAASIQEYFLGLKIQDNKETE